MQIARPAVCCLDVICAMALICAMSGTCGGRRLRHDMVHVCWDQVEDARSGAVLELACMEQVHASAHARGQRHAQMHKHNVFLCSMCTSTICTRAHIYTHGHGCGIDARAAF